MDDRLITMFEKGGWVFYVILTLSVVALGLVIERLIWLWRNGLYDETFYAGFKHMLDEGSEPEELLAYCDGDESLLSELMAHGVRNSGLGLLALRRVLLDFFADDIKPRFEHNLNWLSVIGKSAPMLGLFGTVFGMMGAFNTMGAAQASASPKDLAKDINEALATTVGGLFVALLVIAFHSFIFHQVKKRQRDYQRKMGQVLKPLTEVGLGVS
ncbi:MAG: MotA/TolQ/ExbB proton channel family protein [Planctomycetota bacterium]|nr:MotA/TolQ/ExbB proton channel family protein [Planctomycetota bacterium]